MEQFELTMEDILEFHRGWLTQLYVEERKTEVEIIHELEDRRCIVS
jgi:hypothetical protein